MPLRTGAEYLKSLDDGRQVFVGGERVGNVAAHPAFREAARSVARLYDIAAAPEHRERMTYPSPKTGEPVLRAYQIPKTHADLRARRLFSENMGGGDLRPDGPHARPRRRLLRRLCGGAGACSPPAGSTIADNLLAFYQRMRDHHLYLSYAIIPPQIDRSKPAHKQSDPTLYAGVVEERDDGIVIAGAQQLATGGPLSDYLYVSCIQPLQPGDDNYANGFVVPINAPGVRLYPRRPFALQATNAFDYPLTSRFDESDCYVIFDNVFVPWEHVFIYRNLDICRDQWWTTPSHLYGNHQAQVRYVTKLRFMIGLAKRMNEMTGNEAHPRGADPDGRARRAGVDLRIDAAGARDAWRPIDDNGVLWPSRTTLYSVMALQSELNGRMLEIIRELAGSAMITLPSSAEDFANPEIAHDIERYMRSASTDAEDRVSR